MGDLRLGQTLFQQRGDLIPFFSAEMLIAYRAFSTARSRAPRAYSNLSDLKALQAVALRI
jgi:hypothetical protein